MLEHLTIDFNLGVHLRYEEDLSFSFLPICTFGGGDCQSVDGH